MSVDEAKTAVAPLKVHRLRSVVKGHDAPSERVQAAKEARSEHASFRGHFEMLVARCDQRRDTIGRVICANRLGHRFQLELERPDPEA